MTEVYSGDPLHQVMGREYPSLQAEASVGDGSESEDQGSSGQIVICYMPNPDGLFDAAVFTPSGNAYHFAGSLIADVRGWLDFAERHYYWITKDPESTPEGRKKGRVLARSRQKQSELANIDFGEFLDIANQSS